MKKDIDIPVAKDVYIAIIHEWDKEMLNKIWNAYVINDRDVAIEMTIVVSKGFNESKKTATMRHGVGTIEAKSFKKFEPLQEEIFALDNEFYMTYFAENKLYERKIVFPQNTINSNNLSNIILIEKEGILK